WKHSERIPVADLRGTGAWTLPAWLSAAWAQGERDFLFLPFFISPQGAIGSALHADLIHLQSAIGPFHFGFAAGLAERGALPEIVAERIRELIRERHLSRPAAVVVDHGGPSPASAGLRNQIAR